MSAHEDFKRQNWKKAIWGNMSRAPALLSRAFTAHFHIKLQNSSLLFDLLHGGLSQIAGGREFGSVLGNDSVAMSASTRSRMDCFTPSESHRTSRLRRTGNEIDALRVRINCSGSANMLVRLLSMRMEPPLPRVRLSHHQT